MYNKRSDQLKASFNQFKSNIDQKLAAKLSIEKCERIINRLSEFSSDCETCHHHLDELDHHISQLLSQKDSLEKGDFKQHQSITNQIEAHLVNQHKLVVSGHYLSIYMSLGMSVSLLFGLVIFDNIALCLPIGFALGLAVGAGLDADADKKGNSI